MAAVLLTGASGHLGAAVGAALNRDGVAFDVLAGRLEALCENSLGPYRRVIHTAAALRMHTPESIDRSNRIGTIRLLAALRGAPEILFISSRAVYGHQPGRTRSEDAAARPADAYAESKLAGEHALRERGQPHCILRIPRLIGDSPSGIGHGFHSEAIRRFLAGETVFRNVPDQLDDSLDVRALAQVCAEWAAGRLPLPDGVLNVSGRARSLHRVVDDFAAAAAEFGARPRIEDRPAPVSPWPLMSDRRFCEAGGILALRGDREIARACCRFLLR